MNTRTFTAPFANKPRGGDVWFRLHYDATEKLVGVEEHDNYQGGPIGQSGGSWETTFLNAVARRAPDFTNQAERFLQGK